MSDPLASLPISPVFAIAAIGGSTVPSASASTTGLPQAFSNLAAGTVIAGTVVERSRGAVVLKTDGGLLKLATNLAVRIGAELKLEVQSVGTQTRFAVVSVDQHAASTLETDLAAQETMLTTALAGSDKLADTQLDKRTAFIGRILAATIVTSPESDGPVIGASTIAALLSRVASLSAAVSSAGAASSNGSMAQTLPLIPNTDALEQVLAALGPLSPEVVEALLNAPISSALSVTGDLAEGTAKTLVSVPEQERASLSSTAPENDADVSTMGVVRQVKIRLLDILPPAMAGNRAFPLRPAGVRSDSITLAGTVVSTDSNGIEVATAVGKLRMPLVSDIDIDSQISFEILAETEAGQSEGLGSQAASTTSSLPSRTFATESAHDWPALHDLNIALETIDPSVTESLLPKAGTALGPALLAFVAGMRGGGNARAWLGKTAVDALDPTSRDRLIARLTTELSAEAKASSITDKVGWQTVAVPILDGERLNEVRLHFQKRRQGRSAQDEAQGNRFVIETTLSTLGPLQLDGLVRMKRFDLIVHTAQPMPDIMRRDIEILFARTLSESDYLGGVSFRGHMTLSSTAMPSTAPRNSGVLA